MDFPEKFCFTTECSKPGVIPDLTFLDDLMVIHQESSLSSVKNQAPAPNIKKPPLSACGSARLDQSSLLIESQELSLNTFRAPAIASCLPVENQTVPTNTPMVPLPECGNLRQESSPKVSTLFVLGMYMFILYMCGG